MVFQNPTNDFFEIPGDGYVIPVNCVGVMGKGVALECKQHFPAVASIYRELCRDVLFPLKPGMVQGILLSNRCFLLAATKQHWRDPSKPEWIQQLIQETLPAAIQQYDLTMPVIPALGCGNGGISWEVVRRYFLEANHQYPEQTLVIPHRRQNA